MTIRRDWLKRQVEAGKMEARCDLDIEHDGNGSNDSYGGPWRGARLSTPKYARDGNGISRCTDLDFIDGQMNFDAFDFRSSSGCAYADSKAGPFTLHVHSNLCYTLRFKQAMEVAA